MSNSCLTRPRRQRGMVLLLGLMLLAPLSLLGLATTTDSSVQLKITGNLAVMTQAEYDALSQLQSAEQWLFGLQSTGRPSICTGACAGTQIIGTYGAFSPDPESENTSWWRNQGHSIVEELRVSKVLLEDNSELDIGFYSVLAHSEPVSGSAPVIMQSIVAIPWIPADENKQFQCPTDPAVLACGRVSWRAIQ